MIPLGMLRQMAEMTSLGPFNAKQAISASTGNVTQYGLDAGRLRVGAPADVVVLDAPFGIDEAGCLLLRDGVRRCPGGVCW